MSKHTRAVSEDLNRLAGDARAWAAATAGDAKDRAGEVRDSLAGALDRGKACCGRARDQALAGVKVANEAVHEHPYPALAIAFGIGALLGGLLGRPGSRNGD
ncbi:MAG: DUF883 family protein [Verrucomicrobiales bacterium]|nr:DUF883 family protein [Verrucomicrobiales bacterium]